MKKIGSPSFSVYIYILAGLYAGVSLWFGWMIYQNALLNPLSLTPSLVAIYALCALSCFTIFIILIALAQILRLFSGQRATPSHPEASTKRKIPIQPKALKPLPDTKRIPAPNTGAPSRSNLDSPLSNQERSSMISINMVVPNCEKALSFYEQAFGAISVHVHFSVPEGRKTARFKIGSDLFALSDENPEQNTKSALTLGGAPVCLQLFVEDVQKTVERALDAGADVIPPSTLAHPVIKLSDNTELANLIDPFGFTWSISREDRYTVNIQTKETGYIARQTQSDTSQNKTLDKHRRGA